MLQRSDLIHIIFSIHIHNDLVFQEDSIMWTVAELWPLSIQLGCPQHMLRDLVASLSLPGPLIYMASHPVTAAV
jgi:hypothetical protein